jgi:hypothetical protein
MKKQTVLVITLLSVFLLSSCASPKFFYDPVSRERQKELKKHRSGNIFADIGLMMASVFVMAAFEIDAGLYPEEREFRKLKVINPASDTLYVNMLTDVYWDEDNYCDFMDIRIPPNEKCLLFVPVNADYNVYFSNTPESEDDEMLEINTDDFKRISLYRGLTLENDTINLNQEKNGKKIIP